MGSTAAEIDWRFIEELEGPVITTGYVPGDRVGTVLENAGVTIASGVDLGGRTPGELWGWDLDPRLTGALCAYCGLRGAAAARVLALLPLAIADGEARAIDRVVRDAAEIRARTAWDAAAMVPWRDLPARRRTVVMSLVWQYGTPWARCPKFWGLATAGDWQGVAAELRDFGDAYPTRRRREARYLEAGTGA